MLNPVTPTRQEQLLAGCAEMVRCVGTGEFYGAVARCLGILLDCERHLVMRYSQYGVPEYLLNNSMPEEATRYYLETLYRVDPLIRLTRSRVTERILTFQQLRRSGTDMLFYDEHYRTAAILDELVMMLPAVGGIWIAICLDRDASHFSAGDIAEAHSMYSLIEALHAHHVERCLFQRQSGFLNDRMMALLVTDAGGFAVHRNALWKTRVAPEEEAALVAGASRAADGVAPARDGCVLHWETIDVSNAIAPLGKAFILEKQSPGYVDLDAESVVAQFARAYRLTPRETQIVAHIVAGNPPERIARTLGIGLGTIRNHKHRLYYKLDITTERELFSMIFDSLVRKPSPT